jgi:hypothetical protein
MGSASKELAVTTYTNPLGGIGGLGRGNNNIIIWVVLIIIFLGLTGNDFGFGNSGRGCDRHRKHHHHHHGGDRNNNFFGENGWFILIIFAIFFLFNDGVGGANTNIINVDTDDDPNC